jgi:hypothetical protein
MGDLEGITALVEKVWGEVFQVADKVLKAHLKFGFTQFVSGISPSIEEIVLGLRTVELVLDALYEQFDYDEQRLVMNSKQQILWIQEIATALQHNDKDRYEAAVSKMSSQPQI